VFAIIVVPLSCADLEEQVTVQAMMAVARFLAIFVMVGGSLYALMFDRIDSQTIGKVRGGQRLERSDSILPIRNIQQGRFAPCLRTYHLPT